jgi:pectin methylesterase-like acyl-CoA thioesterase
VAAGDHNHDAVYQKKYSQLIVVAKSGGDFTSIATAVASAPASATAPVTIQVMPGTYEEGQLIWLKSYITISATPGTVTVHAPVNSYPIFQGSGVSNVTLTGLTLDTGASVDE